MLEITHDWNDACTIATGSGHGVPQLRSMTSLNLVSHMCEARQFVMAI